MTEKDQIKNMKEDETIYVNMCEDGGAQIHMHNYEYILYEIPIYGGTPRFSGIYGFKKIDEMINEYKSWT